MKENALTKANEAASMEEYNKFLSQGISVSFDDISSCIEVSIYLSRIYLYDLIVSLQGICNNYWGYFCLDMCKREYSIHCICI